MNTVKAQHQKALKLLTDNVVKLHEFNRFPCEKGTIIGGNLWAFWKRKIKKSLICCGKNNPAK